MAGIHGLDLQKEALFLLSIINNEHCLLELQGLGTPSKVEHVKDLLIMASLDVLLLQETKIEEDSILSLSKKNWKKNAGMVVSARGSSGGIATLWT